MATEHAKVSALALTGDAEFKHIFPNANTNLLHKRTVIPTLMKSLNKGTHLFVHAFYGSPTQVEAELPRLEDGVIYLEDKEWKLADLMEKRG
ncbi:hypothetical protein GI584_07685 [Gracilibacillus salitolerans]|uniref:DUF2264 domain-containing protein n=1 Tax=Gracilibacillus salitolerans TaxID=2663022 RepID=A0A5Q2TKU4_9BACI|nr:hypothetical protein [Gracilibacillus salitolerans]QGH33908.1 hypothetical protein GI584_07685 [Gracilibacillus salitolerans]